MKKLLLAATICTSIVIAACSKSDSNEGMAKVELRLTDAPLNVEEVNVDIRQVRVKFNDDTLQNDGWFDLQTYTGVYNLLGFQNGVDTLLAFGTYPVADVREIRLILGPNNTIKDNGITYPLTIPSGQESGLKIKVSRKLHADLNTLLIDFDAALSVKKEGNGDYKLRPVLKLK